MRWMAAVSPVIVLWSASCVRQEPPASQILDRMHNVIARAVPPSAIRLRCHPRAVTEYGATTECSFELPGKPLAYLAWLRHQLEPSFHILAGNNFHLLLSRYQSGDQQTLEFAVQPLDDNGMVVQISCTVYPD